MSRIGIRPIPIPAGVTLDHEGGAITVKGPRGELSRTIPASMILEREDGVLHVKRPSEARVQRELHGLTRTLVANMVEGVTTGFRKELEINGVGYRAAMDGKDLVLTVGYSHPVRFSPPEGIAFAVDTPLRVAVIGNNKEDVGDLAARIRKVRPREPYKDKGIKYLGEWTRRKAGKTGKTAKK
ncbi:MAG: 50S ribosomal protein L6 [Chloroflexota bacterium]|nr:50S ribosomal protein L6 [Chloroflexota bacterium]MDQ6905347.1 50S ribosomal protein L6 [Chloroflexota bacterium]